MLSLNIFVFLRMKVCVYIFVDEASVLCGAFTVQENVSVRNYISISARRLYTRYKSVKNV
jgi:hypothetical protein